VESSSGCKARVVARHNAASSTLLRDGALLVHSPDHGAGKTEVIKAIARCRLGRRPVAVHVIRPDAMLARYGIHADTALQCVVHAIAMQAAVRRQAVCIVLDGLEVVLSPTKGDGGGGDAAVPVLHGMASYIQTLSTSLLHQRELPFPRNNPLYNMNEHEYGLSLPVQMMLVAVMTCPDNRWSRDTGNTLTSCMGMYRLPNLTSTTRLAAFQWAFQKEGLVLSDAAEKRLPYMAASAVWARGAEFRRMARRIRSQVDKSRSVLPTAESKPGLLASVGDVESEFLSLGRQGSSSCSVQFLADSNVDNLFDAVGGNEEAKAALTDALALDADRRRLIASFGLKPATGILLYGPPGTGMSGIHKYLSPLVLVMRLSPHLSSVVG
jgi:hypothetical protein